jgi:hypothetical protein
VVVCTGALLEWQALRQSGLSLALISVVDWPSPILLPKDGGKIQQELEILMNGPAATFCNGLVEALAQRLKFVSTAAWPIVVETPRKDLKVGVFNILSVVRALVGIDGPLDFRKVGTPSTLAAVKAQVRSEDWVTRLYL